MTCYAILAHTHTLHIIIIIYNFRIDFAHKLGGYFSLYDRINFQNDENDNNGLDNQQLVVVIVK